MPADLFGVEPWEGFSSSGMQGILHSSVCCSVARGGLGIDLGTLVGPLVTGALQATWGFHVVTNPPTGTERSRVISSMEVRRLMAGVR